MATMNQYSDTRAGYSRREHATQSENMEEVTTSDVAQGRIFWLPRKEELPERAIRRAHGKGAVDEGIYNHPVVVVSRPKDYAGIVHFQVITSLQGKSLDQLYGKEKQIHKDRRTWFLPIAPTPAHPDATSDRRKKRFPTLLLADGALLRSSSYVNIRHLYKVEWSLLKPYTNPKVPEVNQYRFDRESSMRLVAKTKSLTEYEPGVQHQHLIRTTSLPLRRKSSSSTLQTTTASQREAALSDWDGLTVVSTANSSPRSEIAIPYKEEQSPSFPTGDSPYNIGSRLWASTSNKVAWGFPNGESFATSFRLDSLRRPMDQFWIDVKGVTAVTIASL